MPKAGYALILLKRFLLTFSFVTLNQVCSSHWSSYRGTSRNTHDCMYWCHHNRIVRLPLSKMRGRRKKVPGSLSQHMSKSGITMQNYTGRHRFNSGRLPAFLQAAPMPCDTFYAGSMSSCPDWRQRGYTRQMHRFSASCWIGIINCRAASVFILCFFVV